ncbi:MAG: diacylglycerol kinase, partial [Oscillospiraceae bacterium]|nr:diacylglycerol kinase [Oscillospiraceae bacterium]
YHTLAKIGKDVAAGAGLIATITAVIVGILLFWDMEIFAEIWMYFTGRVSNSLILAGSLAVSFLFINSVKKRKRKDGNISNPEKEKNN